jgi:hypothetical protein
MKRPHPVFNISPYLNTAVLEFFLISLYKFMSCFKHTNASRWVIYVPPIYVGMWRDKVAGERGGDPEWEGSIDILIKAGCFITKLNNIFNCKSRRYKLVSTRRSTVLCHPL